MLRVKSPQDLGAGLLFMAIGGAGLYLASDLTYGAARNMGPGFFPTWLSVGVFAMGLITAARSLVLAGPAIGEINLRPAVFVLLAILVCGFFIEYIGLAISLVLLTVIAALSRSDTKWLEVVAIAVVMSVVSVVVFVHLLGQSMPGWWGR
jgi:hypothetical protein